MRYWAYFAGKLMAVAAVAWGGFFAMTRYWPAQRQFAQLKDGAWTRLDLPVQFGSSLEYTMALLTWFLLCCGMLYAAVRDQRYRCRVCLRRLRMPVEIGSWSKMLQLGRPEIEYICTYGHGRLNVAEVQISGTENPEWTPGQQDIWAELAGAGKSAGKEDSSD
jgi:hypothetical protein